MKKVNKDEQVKKLYVLIVEHNVFGLADYDAYELAEYLVSKGVKIH